MSNIIISGANQGIGLFMAKQLLVDGHRVAILDLEISNALTLRSSHPNHVMCYICDVRKANSVNQTMSEIYQQWDSIDIVIHNACKCTFGSIVDTTTETYQAVFDVNYFGAVNLTKSALQYMKHNEQGKIIYVSSSVAIMGFKNLSPYANSKNAIESLAKCLNIEYAKTGISFQIMHPPLTHTQSSSPLPIPKEFMKKPEKVGSALARNICKKSFIICGRFSEKMQVRIIYMFSTFFGRLFSKLTYQKQPSAKVSQN